eukprot:maker-scaffold226_size249562-snap-gene-0.14 protein:Tk02727 transcript:maker-scaffold226_size249562-snap-gene-0.14-mRNA-1 annotation:"tether containing ubx domain for glut4"
MTSAAPPVHVVHVLCPTGHRVRVSAGPHDTVGELIARVCLKRDLNPAHYRLTHQNRRVPPTELARHAAWPNPAHAELLAKSTAEVTQDALRWATPLQGRVLLRFLRKPRALLGQQRGQTETASSGSVRVRPESPPVRPMRATSEATGTEHLIQAETSEASATPSVSASPRSTVMDNPSEAAQLEVEAQAMEVAASPEPSGGTLALKPFVPTAEVVQPPAEPAPVPMVIPEIEPVIQILNEPHQAVLYRMEDESASGHFPVDDSFFDLSVAEVKKLYLQRAQEAQKLAEGEDLLPRAYKEAQKEAEKLRTLQEYHKTVIRVHFPERLILQGTFLSGQTVAELQAMVAPYLTNPELQFHLFIAPPKTILNPAATLLDAGLVPSALVHFSSETKFERYLKADLEPSLSNAAGARQVAAAADRHRPAKLKPASVGVAEICQMALTPAHSAQSISVASPDDEPSGSRPKVKREGGNLPKWLANAKQ